MNRSEKRRAEREKIKDPVMTLRQSEWRKVIEDEAKKIEEKYYHIATKMLLVASIAALREEFKFGKSRLVKYIDSITQVYVDVASDKKIFEYYDSYVKDMGIEIKFIEEG